PHSLYSHGGLIRLDTTSKEIYLTFTGGDFNDGAKKVIRSLKMKKVKAHFFFTGDYYRNPENKKHILKLKNRGHYLGAHSDKHLLYASWEKRDSLLISQRTFTEDLMANYQIMAEFGIKKENTEYFMPPYEWYNQQISQWTEELGLILINFSPGTRSNADYTTPDMDNRYLSSQYIFESILDYDSTSSNGLNGFILLLHIGTHPKRTDKFYHRLGELIDVLRERGYSFTLLSEL
ncbi:MAG: polysaccharide deacetylase family protein, partial [Bacteroidota bacterium]